MPASASAAAQSAWPLGEPYIGWELAYLREFPALQPVMDRMVGITEDQLERPGQDILHNRICASLAYAMGVDSGLPGETVELAVAADLLHNIHKEEPRAVLTDAQALARTTAMLARLRAAGWMKSSPAFGSDRGILGNPMIGGNLALIHHITSALEAERILEALGGYSRAQIDAVQSAILAHSTGYPYMRRAVDDSAARAGAWRSVYPEPQASIEVLAHDADLVSQFAAESVLPPDSKWRTLARLRWRARGQREEAHVVYVVLTRLLDEVRGDSGRRLARTHWDTVRGALVALMGLSEASDPIEVLGIPPSLS